VLGQTRNTSLHAQVAKKRERMMVLVTITARGKGQPGDNVIARDSAEKRWGGGVAVLPFYEEDCGNSTVHFRLVQIM
jgi:hypothetical protein